MAIIQLEATDQGTTWINTDYIVAINSHENNICEVIVHNEQNYGVRIAA